MKEAPAITARPPASRMLHRGVEQKLYFHRVGERGSAVLGAATTLAHLRDEVRATSSNVGNLVHLEALPKMLRYNRRVAAMRRAEGAEAQAAIERQFDGIVLGYSNIVRGCEGMSEKQRAQAFGAFGQEAEWLERTRLPIYALGIGIQDPLDPTPVAIDPRLLRLLTVLNDKAAIFAVRGEETAGWLHAIGLTSAVALGCPSLFVYPRNVLATRPPDSAQPRVATAGRLIGNRERNRIESIDRIGTAMDASYVFQNDLFTLLGGRDDLGEVLYDDATGLVNREIVCAAAARLCGFRPSFGDYRLFRSTEKWRGFASGMDAFFGDRFHGGVVFLQCARPAIIVRNDLRVQELIDFYDLPSATPAELMAIDPRYLFRERLSSASLARFHETYRRRYGDFHRVLREAGLEMFDDVLPETLG